MRHIPNVFTLLNLFFGCMAVVYILQTGEGIVNRDGEEWKVFLPERIWWGSVFIGLAAVVDFLDGFLARLLKTPSEMGKQLDSLSDVVSFGVAPGMILYQLLRISFAGRPDGLDVSIAWLFPAFLLPMAAAWRLARFNLDPGQAYGFKGMPTPAVGLLVASLPMAVLQAGPAVQRILLNEWFLYGLIAGLCWLMVSNLPLMGLKFRDFGFRSNLPKWILAAVALASGLLLQWLAVPLVFAAYIALSLGFQSRRTS
jgi:CDP-diacylglycerol--serine O-phosphatidyltransferase